MSGSRLLFVTWDGPQVSYLESLYMPVLARLAEHGHVPHVLQFTWADAARRNAIRVACESGGATYESVPVLRRPVAAGSLATAVFGSVRVGRAIARHGVDVVIPRSTLPALATILALRRFPRVRMLFDADGLPHDERVDFEGWSAQGFAYRLLRDFEASAVRRADGVLTRSHRASDILLARAGAGADDTKFAVAGNGRDPRHFMPAALIERAATRRALGVDDDLPLLVHAGSLGAQYCVPQMFELLRAVRKRRPDARLLLLTGSPEAAERFLQHDESIRAACVVRSVAPAEVPRLLSACDLGLALRQPSFSMQAVAPIKLGEYLLCGLPVLASRDIGDTAALLSGPSVRLLASMSNDSLRAAADWFVDTVLPDRQAHGLAARECGLRSFDIATTVDAYAAALRRVTEIDP